MPSVGIVGLPNVGKTTLFNALTGLAIPTAPYPFSTTEPTVGVAKVPDEHLELLAEAEGSAKTTHASLELLDLPALTESGGAAAGRQLGRLREMDAMAVVLRAFHDDAVTDAESGTDPVAQAESLLIELALADAEVLERRTTKADKEAAADQALRAAAAAVAHAAAAVSSGSPLRTMDWAEVEEAALRDLAPLTLKPTIWVVNGDEDAEHLESEVAAAVPSTDLVIALSARIEEEAAQLEATDRVEMLLGFGLGEGALATMVRATYQALGLRSFYTTGPKETRAWTVASGATAVTAAGKVHSDMERGFIRAEVAPIVSILEAGGWDSAKTAGTVRVEGRDYEVADGDVVRVRFSV